MKGLKIFLAWLVTVVAGSIALPAGAALYLGELNNNTSGIIGASDFFGGWFTISFICMLVSGLCSLPTLITLIISNAILNARNFSASLYLKRITLIHGIMAFLTYAVGELIIISGENSVKGEDFIPFLLVIILYSAVAVPWWFLFFKKEIKEARKEAKNKPDSVVVLDESM